MSIEYKVKLFEKKRCLLMKELLEIRYMLRGTFRKAFRRCGKSTCWCATAKKGHPHDRINGMKDGKGFTKLIQKQDVTWVKEVTQAYKRFRKLRQQLRKLNEDQRLLINELEDSIIEKTKKLRSYL
jgi:hypothetical protein